VGAGHATYRGGARKAKNGELRIRKLPKGGEKKETGKEIIRNEEIGTRSAMKSTTRFDEKGLDYGGRGP